MERRSTNSSTSARRRALHLVVGRPKEFKAELMAEALDGETTRWTINSEGRAGDVAYFYMTAPDSAVIMRGVLLCDAEREATPGSEWEGFYFAEIGELEIFVEAVSRREIMEAIPEWKHVKQPQKSARVKCAVAPAVERFFDRAVVPRPAVLRGVKFAEMHYQTERMFREEMSAVAKRREELIVALASKVGAGDEVLRQHVAANMRRLPGISFDHALDGLCAVYEVV